MPVEALLELQAGVVATLTGDAALNALGAPPLAGRIYDRAPQGVAFPYVSVQATRAEPWDTDGMRGAESDLQVDVWSRSEGRIEAIRIAGRIAALLHLTDMALATQVAVLGRLDFSAITVGPDAMTTRALLRFTYLTQPQEA